MKSETTGLAIAITIRGIRRNKDPAEASEPWNILHRLVCVDSLSSRNTFLTFLSAHLRILSHLATLSSFSFADFSFKCGVGSHLFPSDRTPTLAPS